MKVKGFTLVELLVVVIIVSILAALAMPQYRRSIDRSKVAEAMEMMPALFEARERWMIENQCDWQNGNVSDCLDSSAELTLGKLDIEAKGEVLSGFMLTTNNFTYYLYGTTPAGGNQPCVSAVPRWGASRGLTSTTLYFRGDRFSCQGNAAACDTLSIEEWGPGVSADYTTGCI